MARTEPVSNEKTLYISAGYGTLSMASILEQAEEHFGKKLELENINIEASNIKVDGCSCCYDSSDYQLYLEIEIR